MTTDERIEELKNCLKGALLVPKECAFVSTEIINICIETLEKSKGDKWYQHGRADGRAEAIEEFVENLIGEIEAYANAGHNLDVIKWATHYAKQLKEKKK